MAQNQVYNVLDKLKEQGLQHPQCNTVTTGNLSDVDLSKTTIFPLTHLVVDRTTIGQRTITMTLNVICMDIVDISKDNATDNFYGNDNSQDVLNSQLNVLNNLFMQLKRGDLWNVRLTTGDDIDATPFMEKYENMLAGWEGQIQIQMPNEISICDGVSGGISDDGSGGASQVPDYGNLPSIIAHSTNFILLDNPFTYVISARNNPTSYGATGLIQGLTLDTTTGIITGQLDTGGVVVDGLSFSVTISATNSSGTETRTIVFQATNQTAGTLLPPYDLSATSTEGVSVDVSFRLRDYVGTIAGAEVYRQGLLHDTVYFTGNESEFSKRRSVTSIDNDGEYAYKVRVFNSAGEFSVFTAEILHDSVFSGTLNISTNESVIKTNPTLDDAIVYCKFQSTDADPLINLADNTFGQWRLAGSRNYESSGLVGSSLVLSQNVGQTVTFPMTHQFITGNTHADPTNYNNSEDLPFSASIWFKVDLPAIPEIVNIPLFGANNGNALGGSFGASLTIYYDNGIQKLDTSRMRFTLVDYRTIDDGVGKEKIDWFDLKKPVTSGWNHVCINYNGLPNGTSVKPSRIYLNNEYYGGVFNYFAGETIKYRGMTNNPTNLIIGSESTSQYKPRILYDEFSLFSRMLTKDEVNFLYNDGLGQSIT